MQQYVDLVQSILAQGALKDQRAQLLSTGARPKMLSIFGHQMRFNLRDGFPLVTTKRVPLKIVVGELLWFLSGSTNERDAAAHGVAFWKDWANPETGELGPIYGKQWRHWKAADGVEVDQIAGLVAGIRELVQNPQATCGRRLVVSSWNPGDMKFEGPRPAPMACHTLFQCNVTEGSLSTHLYQRSADVILGVPVNIASYALLTHLLAQVTRLEVGDFIHSFGDVHIYENLIDGARELVTRTPKPLPRLVLDRTVQELDEFRADHIKIDGYDPHPPIRGEVAV